MALQGLLGRMFGRNEKFKEMQEDVRFQKVIVERQKNANERELEKFQEEERQETIKKRLIQFRKMRQEESNRTTVLKSDFNVLHNPSPILKQKNIFSMKKTQQEGNLFFK